MKNNVTEGAIVQHLAKLRSRRIDSGKEVPPPLRCGGVGSLSKSSGNTSGKTESGPKHKHRAPHIVQSDEDEDYIAKSSRRNRPKKRSNLEQKHPAQPHEAIQMKDGLEETEDSNDESGELLVPGADFLQYPNDQELTPESSSLRMPEDSKSKLVILRYKNPMGNAYSDFPSTHAQSGGTALSDYDNMSYQAHYQHLPEPSLGRENHYMFGYNPILGIHAAIPEDAGTNLTSLRGSQDFYNTSYTSYQHPTYYDSTDDSVGGARYGESYQYIHGNIEPDADLIMEIQEQLGLEY
ncbi:hypothetical protein BDV26DRAFT_287626 [Aspergillus bertholletiae]|uniref:Uncharacterized protein n=1 Tax=Aspergillus bertholletiae TaxID=1226010 RepID=A0A5N7BNM6_9EURO|nr:hypothetical protein BDV26DRAFT_287626 [Aspergillus bertholletiae]